MDNAIDLDQAIGLAFKLAHRMRAAQVSAGWDSVDKCLNPVEYESTQERTQRFATFLITPDARNLSSYALRAEALETAMIAMEGVISRCRIAFQASAQAQDGDLEREIRFIKAAKNHMTGRQICADAQTILNQMVDLQVQLLQSIHDNSDQTVKTKVGP